MYVWYCEIERDLVGSLIGDGMMRPGRLVRLR